MNFPTRKVLLVSGLALLLLASSFFVVDLSLSTSAEAITRARVEEEASRSLLAQDFAALCSTPGWRPALDLELSDPDFPETPGRSINWTIAQNRIRSIIHEYPEIRLGLFIKDLSTGKTFELNSRSRFASASLVKIPIVMALYDDLWSGRIAPDTGLVFLERHRIGGSGVLKSESSGVRVNLRDLAFLMLQKSDNTATNILTDAVGMRRITEYCSRNGWRRTDMVRPVMALELRRRGIENWTTPKEMGEMMERIYRGRAVSPAASEEMIRLMLNPPIDDRIPRYIPRGIDIVHKTGLIHDNAHDVGILYLPNRQPVLISAFVDGIGANYMAAKMPIARIARVLYEEATDPGFIQPGRRRD